MAPQWILTAASCFAAPGAQVVTGRPTSRTVATIGRTDLNGTGGQVANVVWLVPRDDRNVVLARLHRPVANIAPVAIGSAVEVGRRVRAAGYGRTSDKWVPDVLHTATFTVQTVDVSTFDILGEGAGSGGPGQNTGPASICKGDSGGPAFTEASGSVALVGIHSASWQGGCLGETQTRREATEARVDDIAAWIRSTARPIVAAPDFDGDGASDIALTGEPSWTTLPVAFSKVPTPRPPARPGSTREFSVTNESVGDFGALAGQPGVKKLAGDFDGDGRTDIALTGGNGWTSIPVALSRDGGKFEVIKGEVANFPFWSSVPGIRPHAGDFNGDGRTDIALTGEPSWNTVPVATAKGDGTFSVTNEVVGDFARLTGQPGATPLLGDFDADGHADIALTGASGWDAIPVAFGRGAGKFQVTVTKVDHPHFTAWANVAGVKPLAGDFNGDGRTDIALSSGPGWTTVPVAASNGDGTFAVTNAPAPNFAVNAAPGVWTLVADFNGDGRSDLAQAGGSHISIAWVTGGASDLAFQTPVRFGGDFAAWAAVPGVKILTGDYTGNGSADIALTGVPGWTTLPVLNPGPRLPTDPTPVPTNQQVGPFALWASAPGAVVVTTPQTAAH